DPVLNIPPGESNYESWSSFTTEHEAVLFDFTPHMHLRGKSMTFTAEYPDGEKEILLDVPNYDFNWQLTYTPTEPKVLPAGTTIRVDATFDNSADNPANPDPGANVTFGEATTDEMMVGFIHYTFTDPEQQVDMPTFIVPDALKEQVEQIRRFRQQQREAKAAEEASGG
ncbi:MAG: alkyl hydroperoxide reductase, partial [Thermoanaerobaculia bacterium]|nr:alkyl hydroperoxide reductase [Thermoanaerobaculia bacterium]